MINKPTNAALTAAIDAEPGLIEAMRQNTRACDTASDYDNAANSQQETAPAAIAALGRIRHLVQENTPGTIRNRPATPRNLAKLAEAYRSNARALAKGGQ